MDSSSFKDASLYGLSFSVDDCYNFASDSVKKTSNGREYNFITDEMIRDLKGKALLTNMAAIAMICSAAALLFLATLTSQSLFVAGGSFAFFAICTLVGHGVCISLVSDYFFSASFHQIDEHALNIRIDSTKEAVLHIFKTYPNKTESTFNKLQKAYTNKVPPPPLGGCYNRMDLEYLRNRVVLFSMDYTALPESTLDPAKFGDFEEKVDVYRKVARAEAKFFQQFHTISLPLTGAYLSVFEYAPEVKAW